MANAILNFHFDFPHPSLSIFVGRHYGAIKLEEVGDFMLFPAKSVDHWGHIIRMLVVLVMFNTFFVRSGYHLLACSYWLRLRLPMLPLVLPD